MKGHIWMSTTAARVLVKLRRIVRVVLSRLISITLSFHVDPIQETIRQEEVPNRALDSRLHCNGAPGVSVADGLKIYLLCRTVRVWMPIALVPSCMARSTN